MSQYFILAVIFIHFLTCTKAQMVTPLKFMSNTTRDGHVFPSNVEVAVGEDVLFQLLTLPANFKECSLTNNNLSAVYKISPDNNNGNPRYEYWNPASLPTGCGVRIKAIMMEDNGRWRLAARNDKKTFQSFINIKVKERKQENPVFYLREGEPAILNISMQADYCDIKRLSSFSKDKLYDKCQVKIASVPRSLAGTWSAQTGIVGQIKEVNINARIIISKEEFIVGINNTYPKISLYCNLQNTKNIKFRYCRFVRGDNKVLLNLVEGVSDGRYSYFGNGLKHGDCGVTIEKPDVSDLSLWKCQLGIIDSKNMAATRDSVIYIPRDRRDRRDIRLDNDDKYSENITILSGAGDPITIWCQAKYRLKYCWFQHPDKTIYNIDRVQDKEIWETKGDLNAGECGLTLIKGSRKDTGLWTCHMSAFDKVGMDEVKEIYVRVSQTPLVAVENLIKAKENEKVTLKCKVTTNLKSLDYCRFLLPKGSGFSLDHSRTEDNAINGMFWYNGTGLDDGDCQVTIKQVQIEHSGNWTCAGKLTDSETIELYDIIRIQVEPEDHLSIGAIGGGSAAILGALLLTGFGIFYFRKNKNSNREQLSTAPEIVRRQSNISETDDVAVLAEEVSDILHSSNGNTSSSENIELNIINEQRPSISTHSEITTEHI